MGWPVREGGWGSSGGHRSWSWNERQKNPTILSLFSFLPLPAREFDFVHDETAGPENGFFFARKKTFFSFLPFFLPKCSEKLFMGPLKLWH